MRSTSRLTFAPFPSRRSVVTSSVCGMRLTSNVSPSTRFTVRLTPSMQTEPLRATYRESAFGIFTARNPSSSFRTSPTPSTCPVTRCPPSLSPSARDFSRLTSPGRSRPAVTRSVSSETSAVKPRPVVAVTVRHTPCTQMESPTRTSERSSAPASISRGCSFRMVPTAWTMPVNIAGKVTAELRGGLLMQALQPLGEVLVERQGRGGERGHQHADGDEVRRGERQVAEAEHEGRGHQPRGGRQVQPLPGAVVEGALEVRRQRNGEAQEHRVGGGRVVLRVAGDPRRDREPQPEGE